MWNQKLPSMLSSPSFSPFIMQTLRMTVIIAITCKKYPYQWPCHHCHHSSHFHIFIIVFIVLKNFANYSGDHHHHYNWHHRHHCHNRRHHNHNVKDLIFSWSQRAGPRVDWAKQPCQHQQARCQGGLIVVISLWWLWLYIRSYNL